jgi:hypothetical protein
VGLSVHALRRALSITAVGLSAGAAVAAAPAFSSHTTKTPDAIACPSAPAGWSHPPVTRIVTTPQSTNNGYNNGYEQVAAGGNSATVTCQYHRSTKQVYVAVSFALPTDANPLNDFDLGCSRGDARWDAGNRVYRVSSAQQWALATLVDQSGFLRSSEVGAFEAVTRKLLHNADGYGHSCVVTVRPTVVPARFYFDIRVGGDNLRSTFWTPPSPSRTGTFPIDRITPAAAKLRVDTSSGTRLLGVRLTKGIDYRLQKGAAPARVRLRLAVTGSGVASCHRGATGTLTISTPLTVQVDVCGHTFTPVVTSLIKIYSS